MYCEIAKDGSLITSESEFRRKGHVLAIYKQKLSKADIVFLMNKAYESGMADARKSIRRMIGVEE